MRCKITMKQDGTNFDSSPNLIVRAPMQKKKVIIAIALIAVMAFMWLRVFLREKGPVVQKANAAMVANGYKQKKDAHQIRLSYIDLPVIPGRNDKITRDIFAPKDWTEFAQSKSPDGTTLGTDVNVQSNSDSDAERHKSNLKQIATNIKLDAILTMNDGKQASALIQDKLVAVGSYVPVNYNNFMYELIVTEIDSNSVTLKWKDFTVTVKMLQPTSAE